MLLLSRVRGRLFFGSLYCQSDWTPARSCWLPQDGLEETCVCLMYLTNKKVLKNVRNWPNLWAPVVKNPGIPGFCKTQSRKSRDWKFLIPLGPDGQTLLLLSVTLKYTHLVTLSDSPTQLLFLSELENLCSYFILASTECTHIDTQCMHNPLTLLN